MRFTSELLEPSLRPSVADSSLDTSDCCELPDGLRGGCSVNERRAVASLERLQLLGIFTTHRL